MAGKNNKKGRGAGGGASGVTATAKQRPLTDRSVRKSIQTVYRAGNLTDNIHQGNAVSRAIAKAPRDRRRGLAGRMVDRQIARRQALSAQQRQVDRNNLAEGYRTLRKKDPATARKLFQMDGKRFNFDRKR
jgi:hypothetical protein